MTELEKINFKLNKNLATIASVQKQLIDDMECKTGSKLDVLIRQSYSKLVDAERLISTTVSKAIKEIA